MMRDTFKVRDGHQTMHRNVSHRSAGSGRLSSRIKLLCVALCCVLTLQPSLLAAGRGNARAASGLRPAPSVLTAARAARSLFALVSTFGDSLRQLLPDGENVQRASAARGAAYGPEPATAAFVLQAPSNLTVEETHDSRIVLSWPAVAGAVSYRVERSPDLLAPYSVVGLPVSNGFEDTSTDIARGRTFLYRVRAVDAANVASAPSPASMATAIDFLDAELIGANDALNRPATRVKADHVNDLRLAVKGVRGAALLNTSWDEAVATGDPIKAEHVRELRTKLDQGLATLGLAVNTYTDSTLNGRPNGSTVRKIHFEQLRERATRGTGVTGSGVSAYDFDTARLDPSNRTGRGGVDLYSRNFNWSRPLVSLPGRAGLDLGLSLAYNSTVWTKSGNYMLFDGDWGWPAPGFRLGFPVVQKQFYDAQAQKAAYMLVTPSGARVSLRQTAEPTIYEAGDSSYLRLTEKQDRLELHATDGTMLTYRVHGSVYKCTEIKDRNGNFITVTYDAFGKLDTVVDTLGRLIDFEYYADGYLKEIKQTWHREVEGGSPVEGTYLWARFQYGNQELNLNFDGATPLGAQDGQTIRVLKRVTLPDESYFVFNYTTWGQVYQVANYAKNNGLLNYVTLGLPLDATQAQQDCPRLTERRDWAAYWNGDTNRTGAASEEAVTTYDATDGVTWQNPEHNEQETGRRTVVVVPDGTVYRGYARTTGWGEGLTWLAELSSGGKLKKRTSTAWTQDNANLSYELNPRVRETNVYDYNENETLRGRRRTEVVHTSFGLPQEVREYDADAVTVLRRTQITYVPESINGAYAGVRIIGLLAQQEIHGREVGGPEKLYSKVTYEYDLDGEFLAAPEGNPVSVAQHDGAHYGTGFTLRGNLGRTRQWDVTDEDNQSKSVATETGYNTLGSPIFTRDARTHRMNFSYADSDGGASYAYPTTVTDPEGFTFSTWYNYDMGFVTKTETPRPNVTNDQLGPRRTLYYDATGRRIKEKNEVLGAYTRWEYNDTSLYLTQYMKLDTNEDETFVVSVTDGAGRLRGRLEELPGSVGGHSARRFAYDNMGRQAQQFNPTEVSVDALDRSNIDDWQPTGPDAQANGGAGWVSSSVTYDWKGRPLSTTKPGTPAATREIDYEGCGCAGGEMVTIKDEVGRQQKVYHDVLGRVWKKEVLNWDGTVYSTTTNRYNPLDQVTRTRVYQGSVQDPASEPTGEGATYQTTTTTYDGLGRLWKRHEPTQDADKSTIYSYWSDGAVKSVQDARDVVTEYSYDKRHLLTGIAYNTTNVPGIQGTTAVTFEYDGAGLRKRMEDGSGSTAYVYDEVGRLETETREFNGLPNHSYPISYQYTLGGQLKKLTDPWNDETDYTYDRTGRLTRVNVTGLGTVTEFLKDAKYTAAGAFRYVKYGNNRELNIAYNSNLQPTQSNLTLNGGAAESSTYQYYADGRVQSVLTSSPDVAGGLPEFKYKYDHMGQLTDFYTVEPHATEFYFDAWARHYEHDEWGQLRSHKGVIWGNDPNDGGNTHWSRAATFNYTGARATSSNYIFETYPYTKNTQSTFDKNGRLTSDGVHTNKYDAAGRLVDIRWSADNALVQSNLYDGDGLSVKYYDNYLVRSTVLGGNVLATVVTVNGTYGLSTGQAWSKNIYANGMLLADVGIVFVNGHEFFDYRWHHDNATKNSVRKSTLNGSLTDAAELDPLGNAYEFWPPPQPQPEPEPTPYEEPPDYGFSFGSTLDLSGGCVVDGVTTPCHVADWFLQSSIGAQVPMEYGRNGIVGGTFDGRPHLYTFRAFADGYAGLMPAGAAYDGGGKWHITVSPGDPNDPYPPDRPRTIGSEWQSMSQIPDVAALVNFIPAPKPSACSEFVDFLMSQVNGVGASVVHTLIGADLALHAKYNLASAAEKGELAYDGFKAEHISGGQNGWSMVHIAGMAGAYLAGTKSVIDKQFEEDNAQLKNGLDMQKIGRTQFTYGNTENYSVEKYIAEKRAELENDRAGVYVGEQLYDKVKGKATYSLVRTRIFNRLCDR